MQKVSSNSNKEISQEKNHKSDGQVSDNSSSLTLKRNVKNESKDLRPTPPGKVILKARRRLD